MTLLDVDVGVTGDDDAAVKNLVMVEKSDNQANHAKFGPVPWDSQLRYQTTFVDIEVVRTIGNLSAREAEIRFYSARVPVQFIS